MKCHRICLLGFSLLSASAMAALAPTAPPAQSEESDAPAARTTLTWSTTQGQYTWDGASQAAAAYTGEGYSDWRLPTTAEAQAGAAAGVYDVPGWQYWTSKHAGNWAYSVNAAGTITKYWSTSQFFVKFVRP